MIFLKRFLIKIMDQKINEIIRDASDDKHGSKFFYYSLWPQKKRFEVSCLKFSDFIESYCSIISSNVDNKNNDCAASYNSNKEYNPSLYGTSFAEESKNNRVPLMVNMKIKIKDNEVTTMYDSKFLYVCTSLIQEVIIDLFSTDDQRIFICFLLESDIWVEGDFQYLQIRFHFPYTNVSIDYINNTFLKEVRNTFEENNILQYLTVSSLLSISEIILPQTNIVINHGCKETNIQSALYLNNVFSFICFDELNENNNYTINLSNSVISPLYHSFFTNGLIDKNIIQEYTDINWWIPIILSIHFSIKFTLIVKNTTHIIQQTSSVLIEDCNNLSIEELAEQLLSMISKNKMTIEYKNYWYDIGKSIYNIYDGTSRGLNVIKNYTKDIELLDEIENEYYYKFANEPYDIRTLAYYAKLDNPELYNDWHSKWIYNDIIFSLTGENVPIEKVIYKVLWLEYIYDPVSKEYYHFTQNRLKRDLGSLEFAESLTDKIIPLYENLRNDFAKKIIEEKNPGTKKGFEETIKLSTAIIKKLNTNAFRNSVINGAKSKFKDDLFKSSSDENLNTMSWKNGVTECYDKTITFRGGKLQDYITKSTNLNFPISYDDNHPHVKFMYEYFNMLHVDPELRYFFLKEQSSFLLGGNDEKYFRNWIGESNASKSQYVKFLSNTFGDYFVNLPNSIITLNRFGSSNGHCPELEQAKGARIAMVSETSIDEPLDCAKIKKFTGNDGYYSRTHHSEGGTRSLTFKLIHMSNVIANVPNADEAFINARDIIIPFQSKWVINPPDSKEEQYRLKLFKIDKSFSQRIKYYSQAQAYLMFKYFNVYKTEGTDILPKCVLKVTNEHHQNMDPYYNFIQDKLITVYSNLETKTLDRDENMAVIDLYTHFKSWFIAFYPDIKPSNQMIFKKEMVKIDRLGPLDSTIYKWIGLKLKDIVRNN